MASTRSLSCSASFLTVALVAALGCHGSEGSGGGGSTGGASASTSSSTSGASTGSTSTSSSASGASSSGASTTSSSGAGGGVMSKGVPPNALLSRGVPTSSTLASSGPEKVVDGVFDCFQCQWESAPADGNGDVAGSSVTLDLGTGHGKILALFLTGSEVYELEPPDLSSPGMRNEGAPNAYRWLVSSDGATFTPVVSVGKQGTRAEDNLYKSREHTIDFTGQRYLRFEVSKMISALNWITSVELEELEVYDAAGGTEDSWIFLGGKGFRATFSRSTQENVLPAFADLVHQRHPANTPSMQGAADFYDAAGDAGRIARLLQANPDIHFWGLSYGTIEAGNAQQSGDVAQGAADFEAALQTIVGALVAAGRAPVLARVPYSTAIDAATIGAFNQAIDHVTQKNGLHPGPDLFAWFQAHPEQLCTVAGQDGCEFGDGIEITSTGHRAINVLWADAVDPIYAPP